jgi:hypothetical protein
MGARVRYGPSDEDGMTMTALTRRILSSGATALPGGFLGLALLCALLSSVVLTGCQSPMASDDEDAASASAEDATDAPMGDESMAASDEPADPYAADPYSAALPPEPGMSSMDGADGEPVDLANRFRELEATERVSQQERAAVVEALLEQARADLSSAEHKNALVKVNEALALLPGHRPALQLRHDIWRAMGTDESCLSIADQLDSEAQVQRDQLRMEAIAY